MQACRGLLTSEDILLGGPAATVVAALTDACYVNATGAVRHCLLEAMAGSLRAKFPQWKGKWTQSAEWFVAPLFLAVCSLAAGMTAAALKARLTIFLEKMVKRPEVVTGLGSSDAKVRGSEGHC